MNALNSHFSRSVCRRLAVQNSQPIPSFETTQHAAWSALVNDLIERPVADEIRALAVVEEVVL